MRLGYKFFGQKRDSGWPDSKPVGTTYPAGTPGRYPQVSLSGYPGPVPAGLTQCCHQFTKLPGYPGMHTRVPGTRYPGRNSYPGCFVLFLGAVRSHYPPGPGYPGHDTVQSLRPQNRNLYRSPSKRESAGSTSSTKYYSYPGPGTFKFGTR
eukprot:1338165-Rhodomonas_salina.1